MSRYLTPAKLGLLALIELYTEQVVPTDAIVPVVNFVASHLLDCQLTHASSAIHGDRWARAESTIRLVLSIGDFEQLLAPYAAADRLPGRRLWDRFLEKLWSVDSLHALQEFFDRMPLLLVRTKDELRRIIERGEEPPTGVLLSRGSPFGAFVRRAHIEWDKLQFGSATDLWKAFVRYRQPTADYWRRRNPHHSRLSFDAVLMTGEHEWGAYTHGLAVATYGTMLLPGGRDETRPISTDDIENLLRSKSTSCTARFGNRVPLDIKGQFEKLQNEHPQQPSLSHYLKFSDTWRAGDYPTSFDYLHRYFDYTMQSRDRLFYQYALMNLAILQSDFGCHKEAVATMLETVSTARENRDTTCLNFALNWLFHFGRAHPKLVRALESSSMLGSGKETLAFLRAKAKEAGMWVLWSSALMGEAKLGMAGGESISTILEQMVRSSHIIVERNMKSMMGAQLSMATTLWDRLGLTYMSSVACEVLLRCHTRDSIFDDELKTMCRLAGSLAGRGRYGEAFGKLEAMDMNSLRSAKPGQYWHLYRGLLKLRRDLHHNDLEAAEHLLSQLLQTGTEGFEPDIVFVVDSLHIEMLIRRGEFAAAFNKIDGLITKLREDNRDINLRIHLLLSKARLFDCIGRPEKGFTISVRAASMAWRARLMPLLWQAMGALANILNSLGEFVAASQLLLAVLPRCLETDNIFVVGTLYGLLADAWMGQAGAVGEGQRRVEFMTRGHEALDCAFRHFSVVEDIEKQCEMLAKKATVMRAMGDHVLAEEYAVKYITLKQEAMTRNGQR